MAPDGPLMYKLKESVGLKEGGFLILEIFKDRARLLIVEVKQPVILITLVDGWLSVHVDVVKEAETNYGVNGVVEGGNVITIKPPAGIGSNKVWSIL